MGNRLLEVGQVQDGLAFSLTGWPAGEVPNSGHAWARGEVPVCQSLPCPTQHSFSFQPLAIEKGKEKQYLLQERQVGDFPGNLLELSLGLCFFPHQGGCAWKLEVAAVMHSQQ